MSRKDRSIYKGKLESLIKRRLSDILMNDADDRRFTTVSIKKFILNGDNTIATVYVETYDDSLDREKLIAALNKAAGFFHILLKKSVHLKRIPAVEFKYDISTDYYFKLDDKMKGLLDDSTEE